MGFAITALLRSSCSLLTSPLRWLARVALRTNHSYPSLLYPALFLSTFCLITMSFVFTSDKRSWRRARLLCGFLVCVFGILHATSETDWLSSTFSVSVVEISSVLLATVRSHTRIVHETCLAGSHMWTGLAAARDLQLDSCCQREMLWCGSQLWIVHWLSRAVLCRASRLNFLLRLRSLAPRDVDDLMIDLGYLNLRHFSDSGLFVRRPLHF